MESSSSNNSKEELLIFDGHATFRDGKGERNGGKNSSRQRSLQAWLRASCLSIKTEKGFIIELKTQRPLFYSFSVVWLVVASAESRGILFMGRFRFLLPRASHSRTLIDRVQSSLRNKLFFLSLKFGESEPKILCQERGRV